MNSECLPWCFKWISEGNRRVRERVREVRVGLIDKRKKAIRSDTSASFVEDKARSNTSGTGFRICFDESPNFETNAF